MPENPYKAMRDPKKNLDDDQESIDLTTKQGIADAFRSRAITLEERNQALWKFGRKYNPEGLPNSSLKGKLGSE